MPRVLTMPILAAVLAVPATASEATRVADAYFQALGGKDRAALSALFAPDIVVEYPFDMSGKTAPGGWRRFVGHDAAMANYVDRSFARIARFAWAEREVSPAGAHRVFIEAWGDMAFTDGTPYANRYVIRIDTAHGRIVHLKEYLNPVTSAIATGSRTGADSPR